MQPDFSTLKPVSNQPDFSTLKPIATSTKTDKPGFVQSVARSIANPFLRVGLNARNIGRIALGKEELQTADAGYLGEVKKIPGPLEASPKEAVGVGLELASNLIGGGSLKNVAVSGFKGLIKEGIKTGIIGGSTSGALAGGGQSLSQGKSFKDVFIDTGIGTIGGVFFGGVLGGLAPVASKTAIATKNVLQRVKGVYSEPTQNLVVREQQNLKTALEDAFSEKATLRKKNEIASQYGEEPAEVFARFGAVPKVVNGKMNTEDIVSGFDEAITARVNARRPVLEQLSQIAPEVTSTSINDFEQMVLNNIANDPLARKRGLVSQYQNVVKNRMNDFRKSYGDNLSLVTLDDIRSGQGGLTQAFRGDVYQADASEYIARVARDTVDEKTQNTTLKEVNKEIRDLINAKGIAKSMNGSPIKYGRFSQWMARVVGATIGSQGIPVIGPLLGAMGGDLFVKLIQQNAFGGPLQRRILQHLGDEKALLKKLMDELPETQKNLLMKEVQNALKLPRLPAPQVGSPQVQNNVPLNMRQVSDSAIDVREGLNPNIRTPR